MPAHRAAPPTPMLLSSYMQSGGRQHGRTPRCSISTLNLRQPSMSSCCAGNVARTSLTETFPRAHLEAMLRAHGLGAIGHPVRSWAAAGQKLSNHLVTPTLPLAIAVEGVRAGRGVASGGPSHLNIASRIASGLPRASSLPSPFLLAAPAARQSPGQNGRSPWSGGLQGGESFRFSPADLRRRQAVSFHNCNIDEDDEFMGCGSVGSASSATSAPGVLITRAEQCGQCRLWQLHMLMSVLCTRCFDS